MAVAQAPLKVFIVEDSVVIRDNLVSTLQELASVDVIGWADSQRDALQRLSDPALSCDLVILDILLKDGTGFGVLSQPAVRHTARRFIVLTNYATSQIRQRCAQLGVDRVFDKSHDIEDLIDYCLQLAATPAAASSAGTGA